MKQSLAARERLYNMDLLRIVSMFFIVALHVIGRGGILKANPLFTAKSISIVLLEPYVFCGVNCFAMLSGYVRSGQKHRFSGILSLWLQVFLYSAGITLVAKLATNSFANIKLLPSLFPVLSGEYWYFCCYLPVFLMAPLMNAAMDKLSLHQLGKLLLITGLVLTLGTFYKDIFICSNGYSPLWLGYLYLLGGFFRRLENPGKPAKWALLHIGSNLLISAAYLVLWYFDRSEGSDLLHYNSPLLLFSSISLFGFFVTLKVKNTAATRLIGFFSPLTFGVYLIHTHPVVFSFIEKRFAFLGKYPLPVMLLGILGITLGIFLVCALVDWLRLWVFKLLKLKKLLQKPEPALEGAVDTLVRRLLPQSQCSSGQDA